MSEREVVAVCGGEPEGHPDGMIFMFVWDAERGVYNRMPEARINQMEERLQKLETQLKELRELGVIR